MPQINQDLYDIINEIFQKIVNGNYSIDDKKELYNLVLQRLTHFGYDDIKNIYDYSNGTHSGDTEPEWVTEFKEDLDKIAFNERNGHEGNYEYFDKIYSYYNNLDEEDNEKYKSIAYQVHKWLDNVENKDKGEIYSSLNSDDNDERLWNKSINNLLLKLYTQFDKDFEELESNSSLIDEDGIIDTDKIIGFLTSGENGARFRRIDVKNADAGANFVLDDKILEGNKVKNPWVVCWYNVAGKTFQKVREDYINSVLASDENMGFTRKKDGKYIRLLMPKYARFVEIEDLNRNFWVISQLLTVLVDYIFLPTGPIGLMLQGFCKEIVELWQNMYYLNALLKNYYNQKYEVHCEVVVISLKDSQAMPHNKYDDIYYDKDQIANVMQNFSLSSELAEKKEYLQAEYTENSLMIIPIIKFGNYEDDCYSGFAIPKILYFNRNSDGNGEWEEKNITIDGNNVVFNIEDFSEENFIKIIIDENSEDFYSYISNNENNNNGGEN